MRSYDLLFRFPDIVSFRCRFRFSENAKSCESLGDAPDSCPALVPRPTRLERLMPRSQRGQTTHACSTSSWSSTLPTIRQRLCLQHRVAPDPRLTLQHELAQYEIEIVSLNHTQNGDGDGHSVIHGRGFAILRWLTARAIEPFSSVLFRKRKLKLRSTAVSHSSECCVFEHCAVQCNSRPTASTTMA